MALIVAFASSAEDQPSPTRRVLEKFPRSQYRPSLITPVPPVAPTSSKPVRRWNFRKAEWDKFKLLTNIAAGTLPLFEDTDLDTSYKVYCNMLINATKQSVPRDNQKNYIPCWDEEYQQLCEHHAVATFSEGPEATANILIKRLDEKRQERWIESVESIDFTHSSQNAWHTINRLTGRTASKPDKCPMSA